MRERSQVEYVENPMYLGTSTFYYWKYPDQPYSTDDKYASTATPWLASRECHDELHKGPPYLSGGPFDKTEYSTNRLVLSDTVSLRSGLNGYVGGFLPNSNGLKPEDVVQSANWGDVSSRGFEGWNKFRPTRPSMSAGVTIGELNEIPRMLMTTAKDYARAFARSKSTLKDAGNTWLNTHFGWLPFLNDMRDFVKTVSNLNEKLKQLERDNGQWVKRGGLVDSTTETEVTSGGGTAFYLPVACNANHGFDDNWTMTTTRSQNIWFSGRFRYYVPSRPKWMMTAKYYQMLFGLHVDPSLIYELTPWSWLLDWCSNTGDILEFLSSIVSEDLCAKYAYIMGHTIIRNDVHAVGYFANNYVLRGNYFAQYERKQRVPASEFGFGLTRDSFSSRQWSILGALGLSRLK